MRYAILATLAIAFSPPLFAQPPPEFPAGAQALKASLLSKVGPQARAWIQQEAAREVTTDSVSEATATRAAAANAAFGNLGEADRAAIAFLVLMEAAKSAQEDLKAIMGGVKQIDDARASIRPPSQPAQRASRATANAGSAPATAASPRAAANVSSVAIQPRPLPRAEFDRRLAAAKQNQDSLREMSETESLRLQMAMERKGQLESMISNVMKKVSDTSQTLTQNLK